MLNRETFEHRYRQLVYVTKKKGSEPSFTSGLWFDEEGYLETISGLEKRVKGREHG